MAWYEPGLDPTAEFTNHVVSLDKQPGTQKFSHGMGIGDINGDGRPDILTTEGYYEVPKIRAAVPEVRSLASWGCLRKMHVFDVNGDGLPDVVCSSAHNIGVWWYEQKKGANGPEFEKHVIDNTFSQSHSMGIAEHQQRRHTGAS